MSSTSVATNDALTVKHWADQAFREYVDKLVMGPYMGMTTESIIQVREDLARMKGDKITFALAGKLSGDGVVSGGTMEGNEEALGLYNFGVSVEEYRNAIKDNGTMSRKRTMFDLFGEFEPALTTWMAQKFEQTVADQLASIDGVKYAAATSGQKNTWNAENIDRILFGAATTNYSATHATALSNIDSTNDVLNPPQISLAKRIAQLANPKIRPVKIENGEEYFVMFVHPLCARDLKNTSAWQNAQQYAMARGGDNPIFTGMLGVWDGVILKEWNKVPLLSGVGNGTTDVAINFLCGAQALCYAQGGYEEEGSARVILTEKKFDYDVQRGVQIKSMWGIGKSVFQSTKQHGVVSVFSSAVAD